MSQGYVIRQGRPDEAALLPAIEDRAAILFEDSPHPQVMDHDAGSPEQFLAHMRQGLCFVLADADDQLAGFAVCGILDHALHLYELAVTPEHGGKGLGRALVEHVANEAKSLSLDAVTLSTYTNVPWNAPFYESARFRVLAEDELTPALFLVAAHEADIGLTDRCVMRREVSS